MVHVKYKDEDLEKIAGMKPDGRLHDHSIFISVDDDCIHIGVFGIKDGEKRALVQLTVNDSCLRPMTLRPSIPITVVS